MSIYQGNQLVAGCITASVPTGSIIPFAGSIAPTGFLLCDGSAVSRTTYSALYDVIGTTYGEGDGNTTFNLPNLEFVLKRVAGNGITLGFTDNTNNYGLQRDYSESLGSYLQVHSTSYGKSIGSARAAGTSSISKTLGITLDPAKSGIETEINSNIHYCIKY